MILESTTPHSPPVIHSLPDFLIDQIKAGEVVERPSQAIKEIVENAIDAGATRISIEIKDNGLELIKIQDNGIGIKYDQLPLAFQRHATSKINRFEDLYQLDTFGFRGEALASVAAVSRLSCYSKPKVEIEKGGKISFNGGHQTEYFENNALEQGTTLTIENLFFNTPARLKFVRSKQSEKNAINKILHSFLISNHEITFLIKWDEQQPKHYPACKTLKARVEQIFNRKKENQIISFNIEHEGYHVKGFYSVESGKSSHGKHQFSFINMRLFQDKQIHGTVLRSLEYLWGPGHSGHYCLFIEAPKDQIDVNVHPSKTYIKFQHPSLIQSLISAGLKQHRQQRQYEESSSSQEFLNHDSSIDSDFAPKTITNKNDSLPISDLNTVFPLEDSFLIYKDQNENHLIDFSKLLQIYFKTSENKSIQPQALLVAEPIKIPSKKKDIIQKLNAIGFTLEALVDEQSEDPLILVRAVPQWLLDIGIHPYLNIFVEYLITEKMTDLSLMKNIRASSLEKILNVLKDHPLDDVIKTLDTKALKKWMES